MKTEFKECTGCNKLWENRDDFLSDPQLELNGYQVNFGDLNAGFFLFTHDCIDCGSTIAIAAGGFTDMHEGPIFADCPKEHVTSCPGYCQDGKLKRCYEKCECAYVTDVIDKVKDWPKQICA